MSNPLKVIEYLVNKIESKHHIIDQTKLLIEDIHSIERFKNKRNYIISNLISIDDDMRQSSQALRILINQNEDLVNQINNMEKELEKNNKKLIFNDKFQLDLNRKMQDLLKENEHLKHNEKEIRREITSLQVFLKQEKDERKSLEQKLKELSEGRNNMNNMNNSPKKTLTNQSSYGSKVSKTEENTNTLEKRINDIKASMANKDKGGVNTEKDARASSHPGHPNQPNQNNHNNNDNHSNNDSNVSLNRSKINSKSKYATNKGTKELVDLRLNNLDLVKEFVIEQIEETHENDTRSKVEKVTDLIIKLNNNKEIMIGLAQKYGGKVFQKMFNGSTDHEFLNNLENQIKLYEKKKLNKTNNKEDIDKDENYKKIKNIVENEILEVKEDEDESVLGRSEKKKVKIIPKFIKHIELDSPHVGFDNNHKSHNNFSNTNNASINKSFHLKNRTKSYEKYHGLTESELINKKNSERKFNNFTKVYGNYFDQGLQYGYGGLESKSKVLNRSERSLGSKSKIHYTGRNHDNNTWKNAKEYFQFNSDNYENERYKSHDKIVNKANI